MHVTETTAVCAAHEFRITENSNRRPFFAGFSSKNNNGPVFPMILSPYLLHPQFSQLLKEYWHKIFVFYFAAMGASQPTNHRIIYQTVDISINIPLQPRWFLPVSVKNKRIPARPQWEEGSVTLLFSSHHFRSGRACARPGRSWSPPPPRATQRDDSPKLVSCIHGGTECSIGPASRPRHGNPHESSFRPWGVEGVLLMPISKWYLFWAF